MGTLPEAISEKMFDASPCPVFICNRAGKIVKWNRSIEQLTGWQKEDALGKGPDELLRLENRLSFPDREEKPGTENHHISRKDGSQIDAELFIHAIEIEHACYMMVQVNNLDDQRKQERKVISSVLETEERERQFFAKRLHDDIGPLLSSLKMFMKVISQTQDEKKRAALIDNVYNVLNDAIVNVKDISNELNPHLLVNFGLESAMRTYLEKLHTDNATFRLDSEIGNTRYDPNIERMLFKVTKELVKATEQAGNETEVQISYMSRDGSLEMTYHDPAQTQENALQKNKSNDKQGLQYILNQLKQLGGSYQIGKAGATGFMIQISIPIHN